MSVSKSGPVSIIPWRTVGGGDASYPAYRWFGGATATGDGSLGVVFVDFIIEASDKRTQRMYSIDGYNMHVNENSGNYFSLMSLSQFDVININQVTYRRAQVPINSGPGSAFATISQLAQPGWGFPFQHLPGGDLLLSMNLEPNVNGNTYHFSAWGWVWESEALRTPTGPRKPW